MRHERIYLRAWVPLRATENAPYVPTTRARCDAGARSESVFELIPDAGGTVEEVDEDMILHWGTTPDGSPRIVKIRPPRYDESGHMVGVTEPAKLARDVERRLSH